MNEEASYLWTLEEAEKAGDKKAVATLHGIGAPKDGYYAGDHRKSQMKQRAILHKLGGATYANRAPYWRELLSHDVPLILREYGLSGAIKYVKGIAYSASSPMARIDPHFFDTARKLDVPVYLLLGRHDMNCVRTLATEWLIKLRAPEKRLILFENSAHSPQWEESEAWNRAPYWRELLSHDVPLILREYGLSGAIKYVKGIACSSYTSCSALSLAIWCSRFVPLALLSFLNYCLHCSIFVDNSALLC